MEISGETSTFLIFSQSGREVNQLHTEWSFPSHGKIPKGETFQIQKPFSNSVGQSEDVSAAAMLHR